MSGGPWPDRMRRGTWIWLPLAFLLTVLAWGWASPVGAAPDDDYHLASIWCGQGARDGACVDPGVSPATLLVPAPVVQSAACFAFRPEVTADCADELLGSRELAGTRHVNQIEGLYPGGYYELMSWLVGPDVERSVLAMRLVNALLATVLLAALLRLLPRGLSAAAATGLLVTFVPLGLSLVASTSPSSWSIMGIGVYWAFLLAFLVRGRAMDRRGILIACAVVASAGMAIASRIDSAVYVAVASVVVVILAPGSRLRAAPWRLGLPAVLSATGIATYLLRGQPLVGGGDVAPSAGSSGLLADNLTQFPRLIQGVVGGWPLGWNDVALPALVPVIGIATLGALAYRGLLETWPRKLWAAGAASAALVTIPIAYLQSQHLAVGELVQPRYLLPLMTLLIGVLGVPARWGRPLALPTVPRRVISTGLAVSGILAWWAYSHRFASGARVGLFDPDALMGMVGWSRPGAPAAALIVVALSTTVLVFGTLGLSARQMRAVEGGT